MIFFQSRAVYRNVTVLLIRRLRFYRVQGVRLRMGTYKNFSVQLDVFPSNSTSKSAKICQMHWED